MITKRYALFGSEVEFFLDDVPQEQASIIFDEAYSEALRLQKIFNLYDAKSELSLLNSKRELIVSDELLEVLKIALELCKVSKGEYDISHGRQFLQRKKGQSLSPRFCSYQDISIDDKKVILLHDDVLIDLGSIAKGYIAEKIASFIKDQGIESGYVDARGDIVTFGNPQKIGVKHPRKEGNLCTLQVQDSAVATSGDYRQYNKSFDESHILNKKNIISATIVGPDLTTADAYATIMMVLDDHELLINTGLKAMTVDKDLKIKYYNGFEELIINEL